MKLGGTSFSGLATAANRVIELYHPQKERLFDDRFALDLLPPIWRLLVKQKLEEARQEIERRARND